MKKTSKTDSKKKTTVKKKSTTKKVVTKKAATKSSTKKRVATKKAVKKTPSKTIVEEVEEVIEEPEIDLNSKDPEVLLNGRRHPRGWKLLTYEQKLDYIATRMLAEDRHGTTSHKKLKESGILSVSQYERRRNREVYSQQGDLDTIKVKRGVFNRAHVRDIRGVRNVPTAPEETVDE